MGLRLSAAIARLEEQLAEQERQTAAAQTLLEAERVTAENLKRALHDQTAKWELLTMELKKEIEIKQDECSTLREKETSSAQELERCRELVSMQRTEIESKTATIAQLEEELRAKSQTCTDAINAVEQANDRLAILNQQIQDLNCTIAERNERTKKFIDELTRDVRCAK